MKLGTEGWHAGTFGSRQHGRAERIDSPVPIPHSHINTVASAQWEPGILLSPLNLGSTQRPPPGSSRHGGRGSLRCVDVGLAGTSSGSCRAEPVPVGWACKVVLQTRGSDGTRVLAARTLRTPEPGNHGCSAHAQPLADSCP